MSNSRFPTTREQQLINSIAITLGIEQPYVAVESDEGRNQILITVELNERLWRNWLEAVERIAEQHGRIPLQETIGQQSFDLGDA
jgi:hypothetical protein